MKSRFTAAALGAVVLLSLASALAQERRQPAPRDLEEAVERPTTGVAVLAPTQGHQVKGVIVFQQQQDGLHLRGRVTGLTPGLHGFHIHEFGDLRDPQGQSAGDHFAPRGHKHGAPGGGEHHAGDLGNIEANQNGVAEVNIHAPWLKLHYVVGRALVVHADEDDLQSQPSGDAGDRVALGVIGIAKPAQEAQVSQN